MNGRRLALAGLVAAALVAGPARAQTERAEPVPAPLAGIDVTEHRGDRLPLERMFVDEQGRPVRLGDLFDGRRPVVLNLGYYGCPMLCGLVLDGLTDGLKQLDWTPGAEFRVVSLSIDPRETPALARSRQQTYLRRLGRPSAAAGWPFLTGRDEDARAVADAAGFAYRRDEATGMYAHAAVLVVCTPDGRVSRYLYGVEFPARTLRLALVEAGEGRIGSASDRVVLFCYQYDAARGRYALAATKVMRLGGALAVIALGTFLLALRRREKRRRETS